jgi:hypothetical protein
MVMGRKKATLIIRKYIVLEVLGALGHMKGQTVYIELMTWKSHYVWNTFRHLVG